MIAHVPLMAHPNPKKVNVEGDGPTNEATNDPQR
jgi:spermidine synthase